MKTHESLTATLWGVAAGVFGGLFGIGGGILLVPILTRVYRQSQHRAHGTSLAVIGATAIAGLIGYGSHGRVAWGVALLAGLASMATAPLGARVASRLSTSQLRISFAIFLVVVGIRLFFRGEAPEATTGLVGLGGVAAALAIGAATGMLAGLMGVGGGILAVPGFTLLLGMDQHMAQGTSLGVILLAAPVGALAHARRGNVAGGLVLWLAFGAALGGTLSSILVQGAPGPLLTRAFATLLVVTGVLTALRARPAAAESR